MAKNIVLGFYQVDSFTNDMFKGNPAGVCILKSKPDMMWMQNIAAEMNLSETAFLWRANDSYHIKWFTPTVEVALCGHATLASAHILWEAGFCADDEIIFQCKSGELKAKREEKKIVLDFPSREVTKINDKNEIESLLNLPITYVGRSGEKDILVEIENVEKLLSYEPDLSNLAKIDCRGIIITTKDHSGSYDFISRFFAPKSGVNEDPVTGSAHCALAPYWGAKLNKTKMNAFQASKRGGKLALELKGDRVLLKGSAITVFKIELLGS